jgi:hypothetical protein
MVDFLRVRGYNVDFPNKTDLDFMTCSLINKRISELSKPFSKQLQQFSSDEASITTMCQGNIFEPHQPSFVLYNGAIHVYTAELCESEKLCEKKKGVILLMVLTENMVPTKLDIDNLMEIAGHLARTVIILPSTCKKLNKQTVTLNPDTGVSFFACNTKFRVEVLSKKVVVIPKLKHRNVPHYTLLSEVEIQQEEKNRHKPRDKFLPLLMTDAVAQYFGYDHGMVVKTDTCPMRTIRFVQ